MILKIIPYVVLVLGVVGLAVVIYRKIPVLINLSEEEASILSRKKSFFQKMREIDLKQKWLSVIVLLEKILRKIKIVFLKVENLLTVWIKFLREKSQLMTQKSREWIKQKESRRRESSKRWTFGRKDHSIPVNTESTSDRDDGVIEVFEAEEAADDELPISELKKPIKEEQKWIDLIVENPKNITAYKFLGLLYWKQHNYTDAKASLELAVKLGSKDRKVLEVLDQLRNMHFENEE